MRVRWQISLSFNAEVGPARQGRASEEFGALSLRVGVALPAQGRLAQSGAHCQDNAPQLGPRSPWKFPISHLWGVFQQSPHQGAPLGAHRRGRATAVSQFFGEIGKGGRFWKWGGGFWGIGHCFLRDVDWAKEFQVEEAELKVEDKVGPRFPSFGSFDNQWNQRRPNSLISPQPAETHLQGRCHSDCRSSGGAAGETCGKGLQGEPSTDQDSHFWGVSAGAAGEAKEVPWEGDSGCGQAEILVVREDRLCEGRSLAAEKERKVRPHHHPSLSLICNIYRWGLISNFIVILEKCFFACNVETVQRGGLSGRTAPHHEGSNPRGGLLRPTPQQVLTGGDSRTSPRPMPNFPLGHGRGREEGGGGLLPRFLQGFRG